MRRALIGGPAAIVSQLQINGGYSDVLDWSEVATYARRRFDEIVFLSGLSSASVVDGSVGDHSICATHPSKLLETLSLLQAKRVTLISTIDVYPNPSLPLDEDVAIDDWPNTAFGRNQLRLERWALERFQSTFIVRLPSLYGPGLEGNALHALARRRDALSYNPVAIHQWYPLLRLQSDLVIARHRRLAVVNLVTEPLSIARIVSSISPRAITGLPSSPAPYSRLMTKHARFFGGHSGYILRAQELLDDMALYVKTAAPCECQSEIAS